MKRPGLVAVHEPIARFSSEPPEPIKVSEHTCLDPLPKPWSECKYSARRSGKSTNISRLAYAELLRGRRVLVCVRNSELVRPMELKIRHRFGNLPEGYALRIITHRDIRSDLFNFGPDTILLDDRDVVCQCVIDIVESYTEATICSVGTLVDRKFVCRRCKQQEDIAMKLLAALAEKDSWMQTESEYLISHKRMGPQIREFMGPSRGAPAIPVVCPRELTDRDKAMLFLHGVGSIPRGVSGTGVLYEFFA